MHMTKHPIATDDNVTTAHLTSYHYGKRGAGKKVYIQASLHADEVPAMLVAHFLRQELERLDAAGRVKGEVILVPVANPLGLSQLVHGTPFGRYDLGTGVNFNRAYHHVTDELKQALAGRLGRDAQANVALIRQHALRSVAEWKVKDATGTLKKILLGMAIDADIMLDLHCDNEAVLHMYAGTPLTGAVQPLAALMGARVVLVATQSGGEPFDEACGRPWWDLAEHFKEAAIPPACVAVTVELRGEMDVRYDYARKDADALLQYLAHAGVLDIPTRALPPALCTPTPLDAVEPLEAPHAGVLVFHKQLGDTVEAGEPVADIVNPVSGQVSTVSATRPGLLFASTAHRHLLRGMHICKVAGTESFRSGNLLSS
ncbi:succinylglutamate desuccinylase/aspartoacylase family protein [Massilia sp. ST3]|uniref:succinylglutamate desuccinylase/aspartoacylase family protein n=1 Tax=Massilia sp. ST3 TaxID=2824903 RepID=UPI001B818B89|nr:succinylglutamate desuccinylase/aspartoacylase family protein [Massilia sp. ST3]MBQ5949344.1 succinylglutamate desuccinylase/aspartoacylase family protein [Massilia sp. ST3]